MTISDTSFKIGEWSVEPNLDRIVSQSDSIYLRSQVMELLVYLSRKQGQVVSIDDLLNDLWKGKVVTDGTVYNCIAELRKALSQGSKSQVSIETIPKKGYRLVAEQIEFNDSSHRLNNSSAFPSQLLTKAPIRGAVLFLAIFVIFGPLLVIVTSEYQEQDGENLTTQLDKFARRYTIDLPRRMRTESYEYRPVVISGDGHQIVLSAEINGQSQLFLRSLGSLNIVPIRGTENASRSLDISPDGKWVAFFDEQDSMLKKVPIKGGVPITLCDPGSPVLDLNWGVNGKIVFESSEYNGILAVSSQGGVPERITFPNNDEFHKHPSITPDGKSLFFTIGERGVTTRKTDRIAVLSLDSQFQQVLIEGSSPLLTSSEHLFFYKSKSLWVTKYDSEKFVVEAPHILVAQDVHYDHSAHYTISDEGTLLYVLSEPLQPRNLVWVQRNAQVKNLTLQPRAFLQPTLSPNGKNIAVVVDSVNGADLWVFSNEDNRGIQLTFDESREASPVWSPDGKYIYYSSNRVDDIFRISVDASMKIEQLTKSPKYQFSYSLTPDGKRLLLDERDGNFLQGSSLAILNVFEGGKFNIPFNKGVSETEPSLSPDGKWLAFTSERSGQKEVYVSPFPRVKKAIWQLSVGGGRHPLWNPNSREVIYWGPEHLMSVKVDTSPSFKAEPAKVLFKHVDFESYDARNYDIDHTGSRFITVGKPSESDYPYDRVVIIRDWLNDIQ